MGSVALTKKIFVLFLFQQTNAQISHNTMSLCNVHSNMFRHLCVIFREPIQIGSYTNILGSLALTKKNY